jgi:hypothetical protein
MLFIRTNLEKTSGKFFQIFRDYEGDINLFRQFVQFGLRCVHERVERLSLEQERHDPGPEAVLDLFRFLSRQRDKKCRPKLKALSFDMFDWGEGQAA